MIKKDIKKITMIMVFLLIILSSIAAIAATEQTETPKLTFDNNNIEVKNYVGMSDTVKVSNLKAKDVIKVYDMDENLLGQATSKSTRVTVKITQLGIEGGDYKYNCNQRRPNGKWDA